RLAGGRRQRCRRPRILARAGEHQRQHSGAADCGAEADMRADQNETRTPIRAIRGDTTVIGCRNASPDAQFTFCSGLAFKRLKTSPKIDALLAAARHTSRSTRMSSRVTFSVRRVPTGSAGTLMTPTFSRVAEIVRPNGCPD